MFLYIFKFEQVDNSFTELSLLQNLPTINSKNSLLKESLQSFETFYIENHSNAEGFQAKRTVQNSDDGQKAVATVKVTPTFVCNSVTLNEKPSNGIIQLTAKTPSDSELPSTSIGDIVIEEKGTKKVVRNSSNGSKRKVRLRRMGSRQSSKTESDTEDELTCSDMARKTKRKTSRAKKQLESEKSFDSFQGEDEVAYVFKIKPGEKNEIMMKPTDILKTNADNLDSSALTSPIETVQYADTNPTDVSYKNLTSPIVKTKRKIFTPVNAEDGIVNATISQEIESSSASDKNDNDKTGQQCMLSFQPGIEPNVKISTLPPLPSPKVQKKFELIKQNSGKDLSPSIRLMIDRYNFNFDKKSNSPNSSGSCSPIWRSPIMDRRVRKQSKEYQHKLLNSSSTQDVNETGGKEKVSEHIQSEKKSCDHAYKGIDNCNDTSTETLIEMHKVPKNTGTIPKERKMSELVVAEAPCISEAVTMRNDADKPRTPLSERALKIKQAKEAFLKMPLISNDSSHSDWSYRLSQISVGSTDSNADAGSLMKCLSAGVLVEHIDDNDDITSSEIKSTSLPRSIKGLGTDSETVSESSRSSRFGLSSLATKLRKVKLKRNTKEVKKMNTVPVLCRQSLTVDFSTSRQEEASTESIPKIESAQGASRFRKNKHDNIKKSKSLGIY